jgi:glycerol-3-phosphate dehydrogenase (NAD(P)+)
VISASTKTIAVLGAGSWGMAIARHLDRCGHRVRLWEFDATAAEDLQRTRILPTKLPGVILPDSVVVVSDLRTAVDNADVCVYVTPSTFIRSTAAAVVSAGVRIPLSVTLAKGIDVQSGERMTEIIAGVTGDSGVVALVGPSHAEEVARNVPTALVAASVDSGNAVATQNVFSSERLRVYTSDDPIGVELGAALKNIVAIAAGIVDGLGFESSDNMKGALVTRGLAEITRLGVRMGAKAETFAGLSGVGDLVTTCLSQHSRNRFVGEEVGKGRTLEDVLRGMSMVAEGVTTTQAALRLAERLQVDMPIARAVHAVLFEKVPATVALTQLMTRPAQPEIRR